ncbi:MAG: peptidoglycan-binding protein [Actinomycetota bacterium]|nr:peptidoglycan-binding protein [Actinomycetota bacterium]
MPGPGLALDQFRTLLGVAEDPPGSNNAPPVTTWYGANDSWCAMTCSYVLTNVGIPLRTALVSEIMNKAQAGDDGWSWHSDPQPGDCVCFDWHDGGMTTDHVGMVEAVRDDGSLVTLEANYQDSCQRVVRDRSNVIGFARPPWDGRTGGSGGGARVLREGASGADVAELQRSLTASGFDTGPADGAFGPGTTNAVRAFQQSRGLLVDGEVGPGTRAALEGHATEGHTTEGLATGGARPVLRQGANGPAVSELQTKLNAHGVVCGVDGDFGPQTADAVRAFQKSCGLLVDGEAGPQTWAALDA